MKKKILFLVLTWVILSTSGSFVLYYLHQPIYETELEFVVLSQSSSESLVHQQADLSFRQTYKSYLHSTAFLQSISTKSPKEVRKQIKLYADDGTFLFKVEVQGEDETEVTQLAEKLSNKWQRDSQEVFGQNNVDLLSDLKKVSVERIDLMPWLKSFIWTFCMLILLASTLPIWFRSGSR